MITFSQYLTELFDAPLSWEWDRYGSGCMFVALFKTPGGIDMKVVFNESKLEDGVYDFAFVVNHQSLKDKGIPVTKGFTINGTGDEFQVFGTVMDVARKFITAKHPLALSFTAQEPSRKKLYSRFLKLAAKELPGYEVHRYSSNVQDIFIIIKKGLEITSGISVALGIHGYPRTM
jgi:hypothetical protein